MTTRDQLKEPNSNSLLLSLLPCQQAAHHPYQQLLQQHRCHILMPQCGVFSLQQRLQAG